MRLYGLTGYPLGHSWSKVFFEHKFATENIRDASFTCFPMEDLNKLSEMIREHPSLQGFTVTIPHKSAILPFMDEITDVVQKTGALNVVKINRNGNSIRLLGYNTDVLGFEKSLLGQLQPHHTDALILGTGGAAKAAAFVLSKSGINYSYVSRCSDGSVFSYQMLSEEIIASYPLIINATPAGMYPNADACLPIPYEAITDRHFLFDFIYNPPQTLFLKKGAERGAVVQNGYDMFCYQAEEAWKIWNN